MNPLDLRMIFVSYIITTAICAIVMGLLWLQNRKRSPELSFWLADYVLQFVAVLLVLLQDTLLNFTPIFFGLPLSVVGTLILYIGLEAYFGKKSSQRHNYILVGVYVLVHTYFTFVQPSLPACNLNFSVGVIVICLQIAWLLLRRVPAEMRPATRGLAWIFCAYVLASAARIFIDLAMPVSNNVFQSDLYNTLVIMTYQMLLIALTFALVLLVNRRLFAELETDILERKRAEEDLRESNERFRSYFELPLIGSALSSPEKGWLEVSDGLCTMLGYSEKELTGLTWVELTHPDDLEANLTQFNRVRVGEIDNYSMEKRFIRKDGGVIWTNLSVGCVRKPGGTVDYYVVQLHNISERKHIEAAESEQRALAEALRDTAAMLNSTLKFDDLLDRILDNVQRVVPHNADAMGIMLLDAAAQCARLVRYRNTRDSDHAAQMKEIEFPISQMRNLREMQATGVPVLIADTGLYAGWIVTPLTAWIRANLAMPITIKGQTIGFLSLDSATPNAFTARDADRLRAFVDQAAFAIENARLYAEVEELAITDALTGLFNRRGLFQLGEREVERALRFQHALSVVMLDIDYFKRVNDSFGHPTGDRVLRALANCCHTLVRNVDLVIRYGGEEFILLLPETDLASAAQVAERLRQIVEQMVVPAETDAGDGGKIVQVTASLGVVGLTPETQNLADLLTRVDQALYAAKQAGRNRTAVGE